MSDRKRDFDLSIIPLMEDLCLNNDEEDGKLKLGMNFLARQSSIVDQNPSDVMLVQNKDDVAGAMEAVKKEDATSALLSEVYKKKCKKYKYIEPTDKNINKGEKILQKALKRLSGKIKRKQKI